MMAAYQEGSAAIRIRPVAAGAPQPPKVRVCKEAVMAGRFDVGGNTEIGSGNAGGTAATREGTVAIIDQSRLRRECLRLALVQHSPQWQVTETSTAEELLRLVEAGTTFDLALVSAATSEHVDLRQIEELGAALPE